MKKRLLLVCGLLFSFGLAQAQTDEQPVIGESAEAVTDEMEKVKRGSFKDTWVHPDADITRYSKLMFGEAFKKQMEKSKHFDIVDQAGPDTILMLGAVVDIVSAVPPDPGLVQRLPS